MLLSLGFAAVRAEGEGRKSAPSAEQPRRRRFRVQGGAGLLCKLLLVVEEVEGAGDDFGGVAAGCYLGSLLDFALDALFGGGIEGDGHGGSIRPELGRAGGGFWRAARGLHGVAPVRR